MNAPISAKSVSLRWKEFASVVNLILGTQRSDLATALGAAECLKRKNLTAEALSTRANRVN
jgi:hypothetical protein